MAKIIDYYTSTADEKNETKQKRPYPIKNDLDLFSPLIPDKHLVSASSSYVKIDETNAAFPFVFSDAIKHTVYRYDANLKIKDSIVTKGPVVNVEMKQQQWLLCDIGFLNPSNDKVGLGKN